MRSIDFVVLATILMAATPLSATVIGIPDDYPTIQEGIDASSNGDTVLVQPGTYVENINFNAHDIVVGSLFLTTQDTSYISSTIIDGDSSGAVVIIPYGQGDASTITGFTIQNGFSANGGGIYCGSGTAPDILYNIISDNLARSGSSSKGGGIYCGSNSAPFISHNIISNNVARSSVIGEGGGVCCEYSNATISDNIISGNEVYFDPGIGAGIYCDYSNVLIKDNLIIDNKAYGNEPGIGGGIVCENSQAEISGNIICRNMAPWGIGGGMVYRNSDITMVNCTVSENAAWIGGAIYTWDNTTFEIVNTVIWGNHSDDDIYSEGPAPSIAYSDVQGGWEGEGNIDANPLFVDPTLGNYNVCSGSPCIDAGDPDMEDPDDSRADIGVYFPYHPNCVGGEIRYVSVEGDDIDGDGSVENPFRTIQHAVNVSLSEDTVLVLNGTYEENVAINNKNIVLASNYIFSNDPEDVRNTVIVGWHDSPSVTSESCDEAARISGFTIMNTDNADGVKCNWSDPTIRDNIISGNGNGIYCVYSIPTIYNNRISENTESGIYCDDSNPIIDNNQILSNGGSGIYCESDNEISASITNNVIDSNHSHDGGGIFITATEGALTSIAGNVITGNTAVSRGGGISLLFVEHVQLSGNTIAGNSANWGGGIMFDIDSSGDLLNSILWSNSPSQIGTNYGYATVTYSDIQVGWPGQGNINCDPQFCDLENGDYHLRSSSCCVGAGQDGVDIGAFGVGCGIPCDGYVIGDYNGSGVFNVADVVDGYSRLKTGQPIAAMICECPPGSGIEWAVAMDVNGSCTFNVADIVKAVYKLLGSPDELIPCEYCPPER